MVKPYTPMKYKNITISGQAASGATTLSKSLASKLDWKLINAGELVRQYVKEKGILLENTSQTPDRYHLELDKFIADKLRTEKQLIVESSLSGFDAKNIPGVFKILVICPEDAVRIDRLVNRDKMTIDEAKYHLKIREKENLSKWEKLYHTIDFWNPSLFDLVVNTYENGPVETLNIALKTLEYTR